MLKEGIVCLCGHAMKLFGELQEPSPSVGTLIGRGKLTIEVGGFAPHICLREMLVKGGYDSLPLWQLRMTAEYLGEHPVAVYGTMPVKAPVECRMKVSGREPKIGTIYIGMPSLVGVLYEDVLERHLDEALEFACRQLLCRSMGEV